jgi:hypothetical protein
MYKIIEQGVHGDTVYVDNPKLEAYKQIVFIVNVLGRRYQLICQADGQYTVNGDGLASLTYTSPPGGTK